MLPSENLSIFIWIKLLRVKYNFPSFISFGNKCGGQITSERERKQKTEDRRKYDIDSCRVKIVAKCINSIQCAFAAPETSFILWLCCGAIKDAAFSSYFFSQSDASRAFSFSMLRKWSVMVQRKESATFCGSMGDFRLFLSLLTAPSIKIKYCWYLLW